MRTAMDRVWTSALVRLVSSPSRAWRIVLMLGALQAALPVQAQLSSGVPTSATLAVDARTLFGNSLAEWWTTSDHSVYKDTLGSQPATQDGDQVLAWRGKIHGSLLTTLNPFRGDPYRLNSIGSRAAVSFQGTNYGLVGPFSHTFQTGVTQIVIGRFRDTNLAFRSVASCGPDMQTNPDSVTNGFDLTTWDSGSGLATSRDSAVIQSQVTAGTPYIIVTTYDQTLPSQVNITGVTKNPGFSSLSLNGG